ncbi:MAG: sigma-54 dependent transcriptional regulator [Reinekea sp.]
MSVGQIVLLDTHQLLDRTHHSKQCQALLELLQNNGCQVDFYTIEHDSELSILKENIDGLLKTAQQQKSLVIIPFFDTKLFRHPLFKQWFETPEQPYLLISFIACELPERTPAIFQHCHDVILSEHDPEKDFNLITRCFRHLDKSNQAHQPSRAQMKQFFELNLVGESQNYINVLKKVLKVSQCDIPVHVCGETGTGKEMVARAIHYFSNRKQHGFLPLNCAAVPDSLFESELFGYEKGAFTSAQQRHSGLVELADNGTLFLDEVDSLSEKAQSALLRFLQTGEYRPVGSSKIRYANTRIISATNANLEEQVSAGRFRLDLLFRLNVLNISIPPLRERLPDIDIIAPYLLDSFATSYGKGRKLLHPSYLTWLKTQPWPGNVRELVNFLLGDYFMNEGTLLKAPENINNENHMDESSMDIALDIPEETLLAMSYQDAKEAVLQNFNTTYIRSALNRTGGNVTLAAEKAGKERRAFGKLGIQGIKA